MIEDEQVKTVANILDVPLSAILMRKALEAYEASKWVKFDVDNESTYPPVDQVVMCKPFNEPTLQMSLIYDSHPQFDGFFFEDERGFYKDLERIVYWQRLPTFKEPI